uniref:Uncharacterized protein n=1 Tax=Arundo donax TaxID=35708 RepID=A0A0A9G0P0_ARUDO
MYYACKCLISKEQIMHLIQVVSKK